MIELFVFFEPLNGEISLTSFEQSSINWIEILESSLRRNECVSWFHNISVIQLDTNWEPSLFAFWVFSCSKLEILVNLFEHRQFNIFVDRESFKEDNLKVAVKLICEVLVLVRG